MTGVDADLATLRWVTNAMADEWPRRFPQSGETKRRVLEAPEALACVEAELSRLREQRDALYEANWPWEWVIATREKERRQVAEARCARLQQALYETLKIARRVRGGDNVGEEWYATTEYADKVLGEGVAGPDTPSDSRQVKADPAVFGESNRLLGRPADSQPEEPT